MPLGTEVDPGHIVLDGDPAPPRKGAQRPPFLGPCLLWPNGRPSQQLLHGLLFINSRHWPGFCAVRLLRVYSLIRSL